ncbi:MAG: hypothetical protein KC492_01555, partial [Myxococcales bacterium]|nr:hypothetical protein [Myxococcales bacterium]
GSNTNMLTALQSFLAGVPAGANVAVAGHSLGGALSPVVALYMQNLQSWNAGGKVTTIGAWPTAGPTPGEKNFAAYYEHVVGQSPPSGEAGLTYTSKYNSLDVIPHAWQASSLAKVPFLYEVENGINPPTDAQPKECIMGAFTAGAALNALNTKSILGVPENTYTQVSPWTEMTGTFDTTIDDPITKKLKYAFLVLPLALGPYATYFTNFVRFLAQLAFQHTTAYTGSSTVVGLLDIQQFTIAYQGVKSSQNVTHQTEDQLHEAALSRACGVNLGSIDSYAMARAKEQAST